MSGLKDLRLHRIVAEALAKPIDDRESWLSSACDGDTTLLNQARRLLEADQQPSLLDQDPGQFFGELGFSTVDDLMARIGEHIGPFRVLDIVAYGGMGVVYRAERADAALPMVVALKLMRSERLAPDSHARFLRERHIQAQLSHPHIARLIDGGMTDRNEPWFAMEFIHGIPILKWCNQRHLGVDSRLLLWLDVCEAIEFAHRHLIIHRDVKPTNVLVDAQGEVKVIDFGIAKLLELSSGTDDTAQTHVPLLTPEYAAPEQIRNETPSVATDVHGLGLLLYEMLCGRRAYGREDRSAFDTQRDILEKDPLPLAEQIRCVEKAGSDAVGRLIESFGSKPQALRRQLQGDLQNIVDKALRKDPYERYSNATAFADDVSRYLAGQPVSASGSASRYRASKFVARNKVAIAVALGFLLLFIAGTSTVMWQAHQTVTANENLHAQILRNNVAIDFFTRQLGREGDQSGGLQEWLKQTQDYVTSDADLTPSQRSALAEMLVKIHLQNNGKDLEPLLVPLLQAGWLTDDEYAYYACGLSQNLMAKGNEQAGKSWLQSGLARADKLPHGTNSARAICLMISAVNIPTNSADGLTQAGNIWRQAIAETSTDNPYVDRWNLAAMVRIFFGDWLLNKGNIQEAVTYLKQAIEVQRLGERGASFETLEARLDLALALQMQGASLLAESEYGAVIDGMSRINSTADLLAPSLQLAATNKLDLNKNNEALALLDKADVLAKGHMNFQSRRLADNWHTRGRAYALMKRPEEARHAFAESDATFDRSKSAFDSRLALLRLYEIEAGLAGDGSPASLTNSLAELGALESSARSLHAQRDYVLSHVLLDAAETALALGDVVLAQTKIGEANTLFSQYCDKDGWPLAASDVVIAQLQRHAGKEVEAQSLLRDAIQRFDISLGPDHPRTIAARNLIQSR